MGKPGQNIGPPMAIFFIRKCSIGVPTAEPPATGLTGTLGTKGGGFLPFQALKSTDSV